MPKFHFLKFSNLRTSKFTISQSFKTFKVSEFQSFKVSEFHSFMFEMYLNLQSRRHIINFRRQQRNFWFQSRRHLLIILTTSQKRDKLRLNIFDLSFLIFKNFKRIFRKHIEMRIPKHLKNHTLKFLNFGPKF